MKLIITFIGLFLFNITTLYSQDFDSSQWILFENEKVQNIDIKESGEFKVNNYTFKYIWDSELFYDDNIGYYGGLRLLEIFKNGKKVNTFHNIKDGIALDNINFRFYDYNLDGYIDFTIPINCAKSCYVKYYLFNPSDNKFQHYKEWDYLRIQKINKKKKRILTIPDGTASDGWQTLYQIEGSHLIEMKRIVYGTFFKKMEE